MVLSAAQAIVGGVLSSTVMVWLHEALLPHSSVAVQVRLVAYLILPPGAPQPPATGAPAGGRITAPQAPVAGGTKTSRTAGPTKVKTAAQARGRGVAAPTVRSRQRAE